MKKININELKILYGANVESVSNIKREYDGRRIFFYCYLNENNELKRKRKFYSRYLIESILGKELPHNIRVHHRDGDCKNDNLMNLKILSVGEHFSIHNKGKQPRKIYFIDECATFKCRWCDKDFTVIGRDKIRVLMNRISYGKAGPFCSKVCVGKYGSNISLGGKRLEQTDIGSHVRRLSVHKKGYKNILLGKKVS